MIGANLKYNKEVFVLMLGTAFAQGIALLFSPLLARLYTPAEYGLLGILLAASNVLAEIITLKYDRTIVLEESRKTSINILFFSFLSTAFFVVLFFFAGSLGLTFFQGYLEEYAIVVKILPPIMLFMGTIMISNYWFQRSKNHLSIVYNKIVQMASITAITIALGYWKCDNGLLIGYLIGWSVVFLFSFFQLYKNGVRLNEFDSSQIKFALRKYRNFPIFNLLPSLLYVVAIGLPFFMVTFLYGNSNGGFFNMSKQLLLIPCGFVATAFTQVYYRRFAESVEQRESLKTNLKSLLIPASLFGIGVLLVVFFLGEEIFAFVLGSNWSNAGTLSSIYVFAVVAQYFSMLLMIVLPVLGLVRKESIFKLIYFSAIITLFIIPFKKMSDFIFYYTVLEFTLFSGLSLYCIAKVKAYNAGLLTK